jgi:hypothetical protein
MPVPSKAPPTPTIYSTQFRPPDVEVRINKFGAAPIEFPSDVPSLYRGLLHLCIGSSGRARQSVKEDVAVTLKKMILRNSDPHILKVACTTMKLFRAGGGISEIEKRYPISSWFRIQCKKILIDIRMCASFLSNPRTKNTARLVLILAQTRACHWVSRHQGGVSEILENLAPVDVWGPWCPRRQTSQDARLRNP